MAFGFSKLFLSFFKSQGKPTYYRRHAAALSALPLGTLLLGGWPAGACGASEGVRSTLYTVLLCFAELKTAFLAVAGAPLSPHPWPPQTPLVFSVPSLPKFNLAAALSRAASPYPVGWRP